MRRRSSRLSTLLFLASLVIAGLLVGFAVPLAAENSFGPPSPALTSWQRFSFGLELMWNASDLTLPRDPNGAEQLFIIEAGEDAFSISNRLEAAGLIPNARTFRIYLAWTGMDAYIQIGTYRLSPAQSAESIAGMLQSATLTEVTFTVLTGWRMEEIAASLPTSGLSITPEEFLAAASAPALTLDPSIGSGQSLIPAGASAEGFLYPDAYILPRTTTADQLVSVLVQGFASHLPSAYPSAFASHGLTVFQAVTLASIIQREAVVDDEMSLIASVFYNRLAIGMKLQTDPTVQYALGFNVAQNTWWTTLLSAADLQFDSPYNTYLYPGLPPGPISNPGLPALAAVAYPAESPYYYFQAKCDGSGLHNFAETFEQHKQNNCP
ncbi:MAG: endolytic transglycosylase MltG [Chloroflexota bacterium]